MKVLVCGSAGAEIVMKCLRELAPGTEAVLVSPASVSAGLAGLPDNVRLVRLKGSSFGAGPEEGLDALRGVRFDAAVIVSGGYGFPGFQNVVKAIAGLRFKQLVFYNQIGRRETIKIRMGSARVWEKLSISLLTGLFQVTRPVELLIERIYIQCAESLGL